MKKTNNRRTSQAAAQAALADALNGAGKAVTRAYDEALAAGAKLNASRRNSYSKTGLWAEHLHTASFKVAAAEAGRVDLSAELSTPNHPTTDIHITKRGRPVKAYQSKYCKNADTTYEAFRPRRYEEVGKLTPAEQLDAVKEVAANAQRTGAKATSAARRRVSRSPGPSEFTNVLEHDGVHGEPVSYQEASACAAGDISKLKGRRVRAELRHTAASAMKAGLMLGGGVSALQHGLKVARKEETAVEGLVEAAKDAASATVSAGATAVCAKGLEKAVVAATGKAAGRVMASGTFAVVTTVTTLIRMAWAGKLTWAAAIEEIAVATAGLGAAELGAVIGTALLPGAGTAAGAVLGGLVGPWALRKLVKRVQARQQQLSLHSAARLQGMSATEAANADEVNGLAA